MTVNQHHSRVSGTQSESELPSYNHQRVLLIDQPTWTPQHRRHQRQPSTAVNTSAAGAASEHQSPALGSLSLIPTSSQMPQCHPHTNMIQGQQQSSAQSSPFHQPPQMASMINHSIPVLSQHQQHPSFPGLTENHWQQQLNYFAQQQNQYLQNGGSQGQFFMAGPPGAAIGFGGAAPHSDIELDDIENQCIEYKEFTLFKTATSELIGLTLCNGSDFMSLWPPTALSNPSLHSTTKNGMVNGEGKSGAEGAAAGESSDRHSNENGDLNEVFVAEIRPGSIADKDGRIQPGDQIVKINGHLVRNRDHAVKILTDSKRRDFTLLVARAIDSPLAYSHSLSQYMPNGHPPAAYPNGQMSKFQQWHNMVSPYMVSGRRYSGSGVHMSGGGDGASSTSSHNARSSLPASPYKSMAQNHHVPVPIPVGGMPFSAPSPFHSFHAPGSPFRTQHTTASIQQHTKSGTLTSSTTMTTTDFSSSCIDCHLFNGNGSNDPHCNGTGMNSIAKMGHVDQGMGMMMMAPASANTSPCHKFKLRRNQINCSSDQSSTTGSSVISMPPGSNRVKVESSQGFGGGGTSSGGSCNASLINCCLLNRKNNSHKHSNAKNNRDRGQEITHELTELPPKPSILKKDPIAVHVNQSPKSSKKVANAKVNLDYVNDTKSLSNSSDRSYEQRNGHGHNHNNHSHRRSRSHSKSRKLNQDSNQSLLSKFRSSSAKSATRNKDKRNNEEKADDQISGRDTGTKPVAASMEDKAIQYSESDAGESIATGIDSHVGICRRCSASVAGGARSSSSTQGNQSAEAESIFNVLVGENNSPPPPSPQPHRSKPTTTYQSQSSGASPSITTTAPTTATTSTAAAATTSIKSQLASKIDKTFDEEEILMVINGGTSNGARAGSTTMYTNEANLGHTIWLQQELLRQAMLRQKLNKLRSTLKTPTSTSSTNIRSQSLDQSNGRTTPTPSVSSGHYGSLRKTLDKPHMSSVPNIISVDGTQSDVPDLDGKAIAVNPVSTSSNPLHYGGVAPSPFSLVPKSFGSVPPSPSKSMPISSGMGRSQYGGSGSLNSRHHDGGHDQQFEEKFQWKVKIRPDGTRYITRTKVVRNRILKEREQRILAERYGGTTTDDDAMSELKFGRYWSRDERKKQFERAKERKRREMILNSIRAASAQIRAAAAAASAAAASGSGQPGSASAIVAAPLPPAINGAPFMNGLSVKGSKANEGEEDETGLNGMKGTILSVTTV